MSTTLNYKGYTGSFEYSHEDGVLFGKVLFIKSLLMYEGTTPKELIEQFHTVVDNYLSECDEDGVQPEKPCSGTFNVRVGQDRHYRLAIYANVNNTTINATLCEAVDDFFRREDLKQSQDQQTDVHQAISYTLPIISERSNEWPTTTNFGNA